MDTNDNSEEHRLDSDDYRRFIQVDTKWLIGTFLVVFSVLSGLLYWFSTTARSYSNLRVREAKQVIDRGDTRPEGITPTTAKMEEMVEEIRRDRDWIMEQAAADSRAERIESQLKQKFKRQAFYQKLPKNWRNQIPKELRKWYRQAKGRRQAQIKQFYQDLGEFISRNRERQKRADTTLQQLYKGEGLEKTIGRYERARDKYLSLLEELEQKLAQAQSQPPGDLPEIHPTLFKTLTKLPDIMNTMQLQYRRISALSAAAPAYLYAERYLQDALRIDPKNPNAFYQLGRVYSRLGLETISSEYYVRAIKADPDYKKASKTIGMFKQELEENPESARAHYNLGFALHEKGQPGKARPHLKKVLKLEEENSMVRVLAVKRLNYIENGTTIYNRLTRF